MNIYVYNKDVYCEACGECIRDLIADEGKAPPDSADETSYDSDEFPKGPYPDGGGESDCPQHCGCGPSCLNKLWLGAGHYVGCHLENPLTSEGEEYVREAILRGGKVANLWSDYYDIER